MKSSRKFNDSDYSIVQARISIATCLIIVICYYLPPSFVPLDYRSQRSNSFIEKIQSFIDDKIADYITGDCNLRNINWLSPDFTGSHPDHIFGDFALKNDFKQLVMDLRRSHIRFVII